MANRAQRRAKKKSPKSVPRTEQDVERAREEGRNDSVNMAIAIIFTALLDGGFLEPEQIEPAWQKILYLSDSIVKGYVNVPEMLKTLREDYNINVEEG